MPTVEISKKDLEKLVGRRFSAGELDEALMYAKGELERAEGDALSVDIKDTNRPDLWSVEGIARELRAQYGTAKGIPKYTAAKSGVVAEVDAALNGIRGKAAYAVAKDVKVSDDLIKQMIQLQEKVCLTFGRRRSEVAIGIFDFDKVQGNVKYFAAPWSYEFVPLSYKVKMSLREILKEHPKGIEYGHLIEKHAKCPLLVDETGSVLSMPPIINSETSGKITTETKNLFLDVTGHKQETVNAALRILCAALADRGAKIQSVEVRYGKGRVITPDFGKHKVVFDFSMVGEWTGLGLSGKQVVDILRKRCMEARASKGKITVEYGNWRTDILHAVDIVEEILIGYGYNRIAPEPVRVATVGMERPETLFEDALRDIGIGLNLQEVLTYTLTSKEKQQAKMGLPEQEFVEIANPVSVTLSVFRQGIIPELLEFLSKNKHCAYPQRVFEIGKTVVRDKKSSTEVRERMAIAVALCSAKSNFTEIKSVLNAMCKAFGWGCSVRAVSHPSFTEGRAAEVDLNGKRGIVGEISNKVLENFGIEQPVAVFEIEI